MRQHERSGRSRSEPGVRTVYARALLVASLLLACSDTEIVGTLSLDGPRISLNGAAGGVTSIGLIDGWVLLTEVNSIVPPADWGGGRDVSWHTLDVQLQWVSPDGALGDTTDAGWSTWSTVEPRWVRAGDRLFGAVWTVPGPDANDLPSDRGIAMWSLTAGGASACHDQPHLPVYADPEFFTISWDGPYPGYSLDASPHAPIGVAGGTAIALARAQHWWDCSNDVLLTLTADGCATHAAYPFDDSSACRPAEDVGWPVAVSLGADLGVLYRQGPDDVRWVVLRGGSTPTTSVSVGGDVHLYTSAANPQPRGSAIGARVGFFQAANSDGSCFTFRVMNTDGSGVGDAPWQLPCRHGPSASSDVDILPMDGPALVVANDVTSTDASVFATLVTESGRRGSALVEIAPRAATFRVATDGSRAAVVYTDPDGLWLQFLRLDR